MPMQEMMEVMIPRRPGDKDIGLRIVKQVHPNGQDAAIVPVGLADLEFASWVLHDEPDGCFIVLSLSGYRKVELRGEIALAHIRWIKAGCPVSGPGVSYRFAGKIITPIDWWRSVKAERAKPPETPRPAPLPPEKPRPKYKGYATYLAELSGAFMPSVQQFDAIIAWQSLAEIDRKITDRFAARDKAIHATGHVTGKDVEKLRAEARRDVAALIEEKNGICKSLGHPSEASDAKDAELAWTNSKLSYQDGVIMRQQEQLDARDKANVATPPTASVWCGPHAAEIEKLRAELKDKDAELASLRAKNAELAKAGGNMTGLAYSHAEKARELTADLEAARREIAWRKQWDLEQAGKRLEIAAERDRLTGIVDQQAKAVLDMTGKHELAKAQVETLTKERDAMKSRHKRLEDWVLQFPVR